MAEKLIYGKKNCVMKQYCFTVNVNCLCLQNYNIALTTKNLQ